MFLSELLQTIGVRLELTVMRLRVGQRLAHILMPNRAEHRESNRSIRTDRVDCINQPLQFSFKLWQPGGSIERTGHAISKNHDRRLGCGDHFFQFFKILARLVEVERGSRTARWCIGAPAKISKNDISLRELNGEPLLEASVCLFTL